MTSTNNLNRSRSLRSHLRVSLLIQMDYRRHLQLLLALEVMGRVIVVRGSSIFIHIRPISISKKDSLCLHSSGSVDIEFFCQRNKIALETAVGRVLMIIVTMIEWIIKWINDHYVSSSLRDYSKDRRLSLLITTGMLKRSKLSTKDVSHKDALLS